MIALKDSIEIYAWAPKPYHKFMAFKSFVDLVHKPLLVDMTVEEGLRLKVIYGSSIGFHAVELDSGSVYDIYVPTHVIKLNIDDLPIIFQIIEFVFGTESRTNNTAYDYYFTEFQRNATITLL